MATWAEMQAAQVNPGAAWQRNSTGMGVQALQSAQAAQSADSGDSARRLRRMEFMKNPNFAKLPLAEQEAILDKAMSPMVPQKGAFDRVMDLMGVPPSKQGAVPAPALIAAPTGAIPPVNMNPTKPVRPVDILPAPVARTAQIAPHPLVMGPPAPSGGDAALNALQAMITANQAAQKAELDKRTPSDFAGQLKRGMDSIQKPGDEGIHGSALSKAMIALGAGALGKKSFGAGLQDFAGALDKEQGRVNTLKREDYKTELQNLQSQLLASGMDKKDVNDIITAKVELAKVPTTAAEGRVVRATEREKIQAQKDIAAGHDAMSLKTAGIHASAADSTEQKRKFAQMLVDSSPKGKDGKPTLTMFEALNIVGKNVEKPETAADFAKYMDHARGDPVVADILRKIDKGDIPPAAGKQLIDDYKKQKAGK